jgi:hypothetical protein
MQKYFTAKMYRLTHSIINVTEVISEKYSDNEKNISKLCLGL